MSAIEDKSRDEMTESECAEQARLVAIRAKIRGLLPPRKGTDSVNKLHEIEPVRLAPSERLLREILADSVAGRISLSDVVVAWTEADGSTHARRAGEARDR